MTAPAKKKRGRPPGRTSASRTGATEAPRDANATLIKKYGNRRLYDTKRSRYVTLEQLRDVIAKGEEIQVVEETTGEDVTKRVMTQIILQEEESEHLNLLPVGDAFYALKSKHFLFECFRPFEVGHVTSPIQPQQF